MNAVIVPGLELDRAALDRARVSRDARFDGRFFIAVEAEFRKLIEKVEGECVTIHLAERLER